MAATSSRPRKRRLPPADGASTLQTTTEAMHREPNALWRFSLHGYRLPGVEAACLALQDGWATDTNLLLYCCWLGSTGRTLDRRQLPPRDGRRGAPAETPAIQPLRTVRRALKAPAAGLPAGWGHRPAQAHRRRRTRPRVPRAVRALSSWRRACPCSLSRQPPRAAAQASLARYLALLQVPPAGLAQQHAGTLLDACASHRQALAARIATAPEPAFRWFLIDASDRRPAPGHSVSAMITRVLPSHRGSASPAGARAAGTHGATSGMDKLIRTVVFDFEGTLVDFQWRLGAAETELRRAFAEQGYAVEGNYAADVEHRRRSGRTAGAARGLAPGVVSGLRPLGCRRADALVATRRVHQRCCSVWPIATSSRRWSATSGVRRSTPHSCVSAFSAGCGRCSVATT